MKDDKIRFTVTRKTPRGEFVMDSGGKVEGDAIEGSARLRRFSIGPTVTRRK